jgi:hypothetical protein
MSGNDVNKDIRLKVSFFSHLKTKRLKRELGWEGIISLIKLWMYAAVNKPKGDLSGMSAEDIAIASDWEGDPGEYLKALIDLGFLDEQEGRLSIHDWQEHNPWAASAPERSRRMSDLAQKKWKKRLGVCDTQCGAHSGAQCVEDAERNAPYPFPIPSPSPLPSPSPNPCIDSHSHKDVVNDQRNGGDRKKGKSSFPDEQWLSEIRKKYDWLDVDRELKKAEAWCITNKKQLTRKRFINWLNRANSEKPVTAGRFLDD